jgi:hypothetical protein
MAPSGHAIPGAKTGEDRFVLLSIVDDFPRENENNESRPIRIRTRDSRALDMKPRNGTISF